MVLFENWPLLVLGGMLVALLCYPRGGMVTPTAISALVVLIFSTSSSSALLAHIAPAIVTVLLVMGATQLSVKLMLEAGFDDKMAAWVARLASQPFFARVPASMLLPLVFIPAAMVMAALLHNITAIAVLTPLALAFSRRFRVPHVPLLSAMLISSNLGGASAAWGDTPAILQRMLWGFDPATFAAAMVPRNLVILLLLTATGTCCCWFPTRKNRQSWSEIFHRLRARDSIISQTSFTGTGKALGVIGCLTLLGFLLAQFIFPHQTIVTAACCYCLLLLVLPRERHSEALTVLGLETLLVIVSLFLVSAAVGATPAVAAMIDQLHRHSTGVIEIIAYGLTAAISADGSAAMLAPLVHQVSGGNMGAAWQLACGICAGSSMLLTSASAGPIMNAISRQQGYELSFRMYAFFGLPFSAVMLLVYLALNALLR